jgi:hypothetical protein
MSFNDVTSRIQQRVNQQVRAVTIGVFSSVIRMTPVDTGRAKGNWQCTIGSPANTILDIEDPTGTIAEGAMIATTPNQAGSKVYLTNNLPYIQKLEYGHSTKAPAGMVRVSIDRFAEVV